MNTEKNYGTYLCYTHNSKSYRIKLSKTSSINVRYQIIIPRFKVVISGDLSFYTTATGRDGHSHARCPYCDLSANKWSENTCIPTPMTLERLNELTSIHASNPKFNSTGVIIHPQLNMEPSMYIIPILHLLIGLFNKVWSSLTYF